MAASQQVHQREHCQLPILSPRDVVADNHGDGTLGKVGRVAESRRSPISFEIKSSALGHKPPPSRTLGATTSASGDRPDTSTHLPPWR